MTRIRVEEDFTALAEGLFGGLWGGAGGGGLALVIMPMVLMKMAWLIPLGVVAWLGAVYALTRRIYRSKARQREAELRGVLRRLVEVVEGSPEA